jgi:hypothetical protein
MFLESLKELESQDPGKAKEFFEGYQAQRQFFFDRRLAELKKTYHLDSQHEKILWGYLLSAEQPKSGEKGAEFRLLTSLASLNIEQELCQKSAVNKAYLGWLKVYWSTAWLEFTIVCSIHIRKLKKHGQG